MFENRKWVIVDTSNITREMLMCSIQSSRSSLRKTLNGNKAILKWDGNTPSCFDGMTTYTHSEIKVELAKSEWTAND
tara:strand:- start:1486 stop:1716 length:231 start_codon:yes stop_codon:yes gene_type:complete